MKVTFHGDRIAPHGFTLVIIPRFEGEASVGRINPVFPSWLSKPHRDALKRRVESTDFAGKAGQRCALDLDNGSQRIVLLGLGKAPGDAIASALRRVGAAVWKECADLQAKSVAIWFDSGGAPVAKSESSALIEEFFGARYRFTRYQSGKQKGLFEPQKIAIWGLPSLSAKELSTLQSLQDAVFIARDLVNMPPNDCHPSYLVDVCRNLARRTSLSCRVLDGKKLERLGADALLAVGKGSEQPPFLITLSTPKSARKVPIVALVGKGVTFDSGGLSIKTAASMMEMKADMSGAAAVIGAMKALAEKKLAIEVRAYLPAVENMINGSATRPGDVVKTLSGKTVEILNTDAEGRLILCDAIALAEREGADIIIDVATLTGACVVALGTKYAGLFSDDDGLSQTILAAARDSGELFWRLPLAMEYNDLLKSPIADMKNIGNQWGGAITAALFLKRFVKKARWAHLDIAGPAFDESGGGTIPKGGAGFCVKTLVRTVEALAGR